MLLRVYRLPYNACCRKAIALRLCQHRTAQHRQCVILPVRGRVLGKFYLIALIETLPGAGVQAGDAAEPAGRR